MKKILTWIFILVFLGLAAREIFLYLLEEQSFKTYQKEVTYTVDVYFPNSNEDPKHILCDYVIPVKRTITTSKAGLPLRAVEALLAGPTPEEQAQGFYTVIPPTAPLAFFSISSQGTEIVIDYDQNELGTCKNTLLIASLSRTVAQFNVIAPILINPDYLIQPIYVNKPAKKGAR